MSFGGGNSSKVRLPEQKPLGLDAQRLMTNEAARPVPLLWGTRPVGVTALSQAFNQKQIPVKRKIGKQKATVGHNYIISMAFLVCHGLVDKISAIYFDKTKVWPEEGGSPISRGNENFVVITIVGYGRWRFYWGTETQDFDPDLLRLSANPERNPEGIAEGNVAEEHSAYVGQCYFVALDHRTQQDRPTLQNIEVVVTRPPQVGGWMPDPEVDGDADLAGIVADALINPRYGLGLDDASTETTRLDRAGLLAVSEALGTEGIGVSPLLTNVEPFGQFLTLLLEYVDGYHGVTPDGRLTLGLVREVPCGDPTLPVIDEFCLTDVPSFDVPGWESTHNDVWVKFANRMNEYNDEATPGSHAGNLAITGEPNFLMLDRPWITSPTVADKVARVAGKLLSVVHITGLLSVRKSKLQGLTKGSGFYFNYSPWGICWLHCRVLTVRMPNPFDPEVQLEVEVDRSSVTEQTFVPPAYVPPGRIVQQVQPFEAMRVLELPYDPVIGEVPMLGFLARRDSAMIDLYQVHRRVGDSSYEQVHTVEFFPWHGSLDADYSATDTGDMSITLGGVDLTLPEITPAEAGQNKLLALIGDEIFSVYDAIAGAEPNQYTISVIRERYDTGKKNHAAGAEVWIFESADMRGNAFNAIDQATNAGAVQVFKFQPELRGTTMDLGDVADTVQVTFSDRVKRYWKPRDLNAVAVGMPFAPGYFSDTSTIQITWTRVNRDGGAAFPVPSLLTDLWVLQFSYPSGAILQEITLAANTASYTMPHSEWGQWLNPAVDFKIRLFARQNGLDSREYHEMDMIKIT